MGLDQLHRGARGGRVDPDRARHRWLELNELADDLDRLAIPVVARFSTHPHWDHLLWDSRFGDVPRYATAAGAHAASEARELAQALAAESASGIPLELITLVTPLPADGGPRLGEIIEPGLAPGDLG